MNILSKLFLKEYTIERYIDTRWVLDSYKFAISPKRLIKKLNGRIWPVFDEKYIYFSRDVNKSEKDPLGFQSYRIRK
jgi:hypothetical protein